VTFICVRIQLEAHALYGPVVGVDLRKILSADRVWCLLINPGGLVRHSGWVSGSGPQRPSYDDLAVLIMEQAARIAEQDAAITALTR
jgi:hypothetical protein